MNDFVFNRVGPAAIHGVVALVVAFILTRVFRRLPADSQAWIWRLAIGRFLLALMWEWPVAMLPAVRPVVETVSVPAGMTSVEIPAVPVAPDSAIDWHPFSWIWAVGTLLVVLIGAFRWVHLVRLAHRGKIVSPNVRTSEEATVPFLVGNLIVLPLSMPAESCDVALAHEMAHRLRRDPLYSLPNFAVSALFWFVFPVWLALREYAIQVEIDCDRRALRLAGVSPRHYGSMLVALATGSTPPVGVSAMAGSPSALSRRLTAMKNQQHPRNLATLALTLAAGALVFIPIRPVSAASPVVQTIEVKQSQAKVERVQRELAQAIADLNRAVKKSYAKTSQNLSKEQRILRAEQQKMDVDVALSRARQREIEVRYKSMPVLTTPPLAAEVAFERQKEELLLEFKKAQTTNLQQQRRAVESPIRPDVAWSIQDRIQRLEAELRQLKDSMATPPRAGREVIPGAAPVPDFAIGTVNVEKMSPLALPSGGGPEGVASDSPKARLAQPTAITYGIGTPDLARTNLIPASPPAGIEVLGGGGMAPAEATRIAIDRMAGDERLIEARAADRAVRVSSPVSVYRKPVTLQIAAGKNGTITVIENGKTRTVRIDPKTRTAKVNGYTIFMDGKKTADGSYIIRLVRD
jgi:beta-lactamase regulating signal transducer with metallopeptidase domain